MPDITIELTERVKSDYQNLPKHVKRKFKKQLRFLATDPRHPSLRIHPIRGSSDYWEFYIDDKHRCVFRREGNVYYLIAAGSHEVVDEFSRR
jgi:Txe/YoeB family toxin of Txe-Axe toxin-antitoxin module